MATESRRSSSSVIDRLLSQPRRFGFFQAVRLLERDAKREYRGKSEEPPRPVDPSQTNLEPVRFRAHPSLAFPVSEIVDIGPMAPGKDQRPRPTLEMVVSFFGLTGPTGVLPQHYTALLIRSIRAKSLALRDFLDLFNHRLISLFAQAWVKYRLPFVYEKSTQRAADPISGALRAIIGIGGEHVRERMRVSDEWLLYYAGAFAHVPRSVAGLEAMLSEYFGQPVRAEQFRGRWLVLAPEERTVLPDGNMTEGSYHQLDTNATLGDRVWNVQGNFRLCIGPLSYQQFSRFMPGGVDLAELAELTAFYVGSTLGFDVQLTLRREEVPPCRLAVTGNFVPRLGWNTWLKHDEFLKDASDTILIPQ